jgi:hypothetical protein
MSTVYQPAPTPKWMSVIGWIISILPALALLASGAFKLMPPPPEIAAGLKHLGWQQSSMPGLGVLELTCALIYLIPRSSVLGAILMTGYLGGAVATHARVGDPLAGLAAPVIVGILVWLGLVLRDAHVRAILPLRREPFPLPLLVTIPLALLLIVGALAVGALMQPAEFHIERTAAMQASPVKVFEHVNDFHKWQEWSPWAKIDPKATVTYEGPTSGEGAVFKWSGNDKVGAGTMTLIESKPNDRIKIKLEFSKPFEATHEVEFTFKPEGDKTIVTWGMSGHSEYIAKAFHLVMDMNKMVGGQYEDGLANLKKIVEAP